ncbi:MAG TPA: helix-turn-helix domain-containing protein [Ferrovibrio sp.]|uniref:TetR/AcrR family transcriptional regulator n=1 Tax=Ferrovibrio sp. TaxID=1917215 RepID=UPI002ED27D25
MSTAKKTAPPLPKRERTRQQLLLAAAKVFAERGFDAAAIQEITAAAGVANGTFYNYFPTKEAILEAAAIQYGVSFCERISASYAHIEDGAERMAIGGRNYMTLALEQPQMARFMLSVALSSKVWDEKIRPYIHADLMLGIRQKRFHVASKEAAMDLISGTNMAAIRSLLTGAAGRSHISAVAASILRGLGMAPKDADEVARRPLPPLPPLA